MGDVFLFEKENRIAGKLLAFRSVIKVRSFNAKMFFIINRLFYQASSKRLLVSKRLGLLIDCPKKVTEIHKSFLLVYGIINSLL